MDPRPSRPSKYPHLQLDTGDSRARPQRRHEIAAAQRGLKEKGDAGSNCHPDVENAPEEAPQTVARCSHLSTVKARRKKSYRDAGRRADVLGRRLNRKGVD